MLATAAGRRRAPTESVAPAVSPIGYRPGLDGIRAVAVLAVLAYHLDAPWMAGGFLGVDLFMVLSGYLITSLLLGEVERHGTIRWRAFWLRRARRILPAVLLLLTAVGLYAWWWANPVERASLRLDSIAALTSWANWRAILDDSGYWTQFGPVSPLNHMWSLSVEEQFYVMWPLVVGLLLRRRLAIAIAVTIAGITASALVMALLFDPASPSRAYLGTDTRAQTLLVGALGAVLLRPSPSRPGPTARAASAIGVASAIPILVLLIVADDRASWMYHGGFLVFAVAALGLVVAGASPGGVARILAIAPLTWIGRRSYGWYLWHWPLIVWCTPERLGFGGAPRVVAVVGATAVAAELSLRLVEAPMLSGALGRRFGRRAPTVAVAYVLGLAVVLIATTSVSAYRAPELTEADLSPSLGEVIVVTDVPAEDPVAVGDFADRPRVGPTQVGATADEARLHRPSDAISSRPVSSVLVQGDSVALFAFLPAEEAFAASGIDLANRTFPGQSITNPAVVDAVLHHRPDVSIWQVSLWDTGDPDEIRRSYEWFVSASLGIGADVVLLDRPVVRPDIENPERLWAREVARSIAAEHELSATLSGVPSRVHWFDSSVVWGPDMVIDRDGDGIPERFRDGVHVCPQGSARVTVWLLDELARRYPTVRPGDPDVWLQGDWLTSPLWRDKPAECDPV